ncbi:glycosidase [Kribbella aluminosa]|uniref:Glycosidase n=1 Tax=Kribbella aluminosa TaxID=416017 RepID=A0ABS4UK73_9ACTN|nr:alpha-amylase family glycosyl hydrolase [Kribbella aluminosa]MBP2352052.1 glycosidase [Kribbella aluminosa]
MPRSSAISARVGADTVWLQQFYVSSYLDSGYDVVDHRDVSARFGTMADSENLAERCHRLDLRVIVELVVPRLLRRAAESRDDPALPGPVLPGVEDSIWTYDEHAGRYYRQTFYRHEADLDVGRPEVRAEIAGIIRHWLDRGVDGVRVDAVPYMVPQAALTDEREDGYWFLIELAPGWWRPPSLRSPDPTTCS